MTLIIAHRDGWMLTDKMVTQGGYLKVPTRAMKLNKLRSVHLDGCVAYHAFAGATGSGAVCRALASMPDDLSVPFIHLRLSDKMQALKPEDKRTNALVLERDYQNKPAIFDIDADGCVDVIEQNYWAIGVGQEYVLGFFDSLVSVGLRVTICDGIRALKEAAQLFHGISEEYDYDWLHETECDARGMLPRCYREGCGFCGGPMKSINR